MSTKHVFNSSEGLVLKSLRGAVAANPSLKLHAPSKSVYVSPHPQLHQPQSAPVTVAVVSGGGAGHEPAHAGYTGRGMLTASVSGDIFASPSAKQILQTIQLASSGTLPNLGVTGPASSDKLKDVLVIINNYTGDRLNFGLAIEKALTSMPVKIESVVVADDVSLLSPTSSSPRTPGLVGARGLAGNILVCKILGAFAERGMPLEHVKKLGEAVVHNLASIGVGLEHCHVPGREPWGSGANEGMVMGEQECEIGLGLHNEPGVERREMESPTAIIREMLKLILHSKDGDEYGFLKRTTMLHGNSAAERDEVILFINNLGGISQLEMGAILDETLMQLDELEIYPLRIYLSAYMTSLNAPGFSISILNNSGVQRMLQTSSSSGDNVADLANIPDLLDDPTEALAWVGVRSHWPIKGQARVLEAEVEHVSLSTHGIPVSIHKNDAITRAWSFTGISPEAIKSGIKSACDAVLKAEREMTEFDTIVGDGDCGETFSSGAKAILSFIESKNVDLGRLAPDKLIYHIAEVLEDSMGGTIGALFAIFFTALSTAISHEPLTFERFRKAFDVALNALGKHTPAKIGDRTLVDALAPFCAALSSGMTLEEAARGAKGGAERTRGMQAVLGRATYISAAGNTDNLPPDPGAWGVAAIVEGFSNGLHAVT